MLKRFILYLMAIFFPWAVLLLWDNPGGAFVALVMQATIVGWLPATFWAFNAMKEKPQKKDKKK